MKNSIPYILMLIVLFAGAIAGYMIEDDIEKDKTEINNLYIGVLEYKIDSLEFKLDSIHKSFNKYGVIIDEDTLKVISMFTTRKGKERIISTMPLHIGENKDYFTLDENTGLHIKLIKYLNGNTNRRFKK